MMPHVLVAEDDAAILDGLKTLLESEGYQVTAAANGTEALARFAEIPCDLVLLDIMMPGVSGFDVCRRIREKNRQVPILFLSAKNEEIDTVLGLELGGDDYITKPFGVRELLARVAAALRRSRASAGTSAPETDSDMVFGAAAIDVKGYRVTLNGQISDLSAKEMGLVRMFARHPGEVLTRDRLLDSVWGMTYYGNTRTLDQHVAKLRKKVEPDPSAPRFLITVHGVGYRYEP